MSEPKVKTHLRVAEVIVRGSYMWIAEDGVVMFAPRLADGSADMGEAGPVEFDQIDQDFADEIRAALKTSGAAAANTERQAK